MSGAAEALGRQMAGARDLSAVVRSMKALAASSIRQYERAVEALTDYYRTVELGLSVCLREQPIRTAPTGRARNMTRAAILFGSDQGLVGRFNEVLMNHAHDTLASLPGKTSAVWTIGARMQELVTDPDLPVPVVYGVPLSIDGITLLVDRLLIAIAAELKRDPGCEIYVFHNQPRVAAGYVPANRRLLPLDAAWERNVAGLPWPDKRLPELIGDATTDLAAFIRGYLFVVLYQACAESLASENASRLAAMQRADENIAQLLSDLTRRYHRLRQASIDEDLADVTSGYEAVAKREAPR